jgi:hypothetical protein
VTSKELPSEPTLKPFQRAYILSLGKVLKIEAQLIASPFK